ncbi:MAG: hypothetical protein ACLSHU_08585 [Oscillospiraceae bacterium]
MLQTAYYEVANRLERIDFPSIWPGFSSGSFALYQEKLACVSGQLVPRPPEFRGNTAILWQGSPLAIWNLEQEMDLDQLASYLVHELFHAHQLASGETRFPQDIRLALSPAPLPSLASRLREGRLLAQAASAGPEAAQAHLTDFCALRRQRQERPECLQECLVETVEGTAEFVGLQALRTLSPEKYQRELDRYRALLQQPGPLLTDARRMAYPPGALTLLSARRGIGPAPSPTWAKPASLLLPEPSTSLRSTSPLVLRSPGGGRRPGRTRGPDPPPGRSPIPGANPRYRAGPLPHLRL